MLTEERHEKIMRLVNTSGAVSVQDLVSFLNISESTVRRDLLTLDREGRLRRVHGGATTLRDDSSYEADMENLQDKYSIHMSDKRRIAQYAASLIKKDDFVYLDAGSTTEQMADFLAGSEATFVTNSIPLAQKLGRSGSRIYILPGRVKGDTEAIVGSENGQMRRQVERPEPRERLRVERRIDDLIGNAFFVHEIQKLSSSPSSAKSP